MKIIKAVLTIILLLVLLSIPRLVSFLLHLVIRIVTITNNTLRFLIKSIEEELNKEQNGSQSKKD